MVEEPVYISSACNPTAYAAHWGKNNLICYASSNAIFIYNPEIGGGKVVKTLCKHKGRVDTVKWITGKDYETELISGSTDKTAILWTLKDKEYIPNILSGHGHNINVVEGVYLERSPKNLIIATGSVDSTIRIWVRPGEHEQISQSQLIDLNDGLPLALKFAFLNCGTLLLATAMDNSKVDLYLDENEDSISLKKSFSIESHNDWVRGIEFTKEGSDIILATSSQDTLIHLHRITDNPDKHSRLEMKTSKTEYKIIKESILLAHEGWVYSINKHPTSLKLLSASIDKSIIIWEYNSAVNLWLETDRLGEVGGNTLGFYGAMFGPDGRSILGYSYHGAFHIWKLDEQQCWIPSVTVNGHYNEVVDIGWDPKGKFLVSSSMDQTTRIHAPWENEKNEVTWHEIARPQVHGYDMSSLAVLSKYKFVSSAEEKVIRAFHAPENFIENFRRICKDEDDDDDDDIEEDLPKGASVPSLGLSNKAVYDNDNAAEAFPRDHKEPYPEESHFTATELRAPPTEETLIQNTLWPEIQKLYGHGFEVYSLAATTDGKLLASACKSTTREHAAILLWDTTSWSQIQQLVSHTLTVVQMSFSPNSKHLLSVSRDRRWSIFTRNDDGDKFELVATVDKKTGVHTRIIWTCAWSHDSLYFATGSRDGKVAVWTRNKTKEPERILGQYELASAHLDLKESVTASSFAPVPVKDRYLIGLGLESGVVHLYLWCKEWLRVLTYDNSIAHHLTVKKLSFRPVLGRAGHETSEEDRCIVQLASCSADHSVRIYDVDINKW